MTGQNKWCSTFLLACQGFLDSMAAQSLLTKTLEPWRLHVVKCHVILTCTNEGESCHRFGIWNFNWHSHYASDFIQSKVIFPKCPLPCGTPYSGYPIFWKGNNPGGYLLRDRPQSKSSRPRSDTAVEFPMRRIGQLQANTILWIGADSDYSAYMMHYAEE